MFEDNLKNIFLDDYSIYFLAKELNVEQIIGIGIEFETMNKELKNEVKQECYDFLLKNGIISMDFSGKTIVRDEYKDLIYSLTKPEYCFIIQDADNDKNESYQRKIYKNGKKYVGLDYITENESQVYEFEDFETASDFIFFGLNICSNQIPENLESYIVDDLEKELNDSNRCIIATEYIATEDSYEAVQKIYILKEDWYEVCSDEFEQSVLNKVLYPITLNVQEEN